MNALLLLTIAAFLFTFIVTSFVKPKYGLFILLLTRPIIDHIDPLRTSQIPGLGINYLQFIGLFIPLILLFILIIKKYDAAHKSISFYDNRLSNYYFLYILACIPAVFLARETFLMAGDWLRLFTLWVTLIYALNVLRSKEDLQQALFVIILSSLYPLAQFFIDFLTNDFVVMNSRLRNLGGYHHQGMASRTLLTFVPAYLVFMSLDGLTRMKRTIYTLLFIFLLTSIYYTYFRTIILALSVLLFSHFYFRRYFKLISISLFVAILAILTIPPYVWQEIIRESSAVLVNFDKMFGSLPTAYDDLLSGRFGIWRVLLNNYVYQSTTTNILFGFGYELPARGLDVNIAHNQLIQVINRFGTLPAVLFYFFLIKTIAYSLKRNIGLIPNALTAYLLALLCATFAGDLFSDVRTLWYFGPYLAILIQYHSLNKTAPSSTAISYKD